MKIIKRSGAEVEFDPHKIVVAVSKANDSVVEAERLSHHQIAHIVEKVEKQCLAVNRRRRGERGAEYQAFLKRGGNSGYGRGSDHESARL